MSTKKRHAIKTGTFLFLHLLLMVYSFGGLFSKRASGCAFLNKEFLLNYGIEILILTVYAIGWQQVLKNLPLTLAFANKAVTIVWGIVWGAIFFSEPVTMGRVVGALLVVVGVVLFAFSNQETGKR